MPKRKSEKAERLAQECRGMDDLLKEVAASYAEAVTRRDNAERNRVATQAEYEKAEQRASGLERELEDYREDNRALDKEANRAVLWCVAWFVVAIAATVAHIVRSYPDEAPAAQAAGEEVQSDE